MAKITVEPYLFFNGNAKEAMEFYKTVFGGELDVSTMADSPPEAQMPGTKPTDVMHASLKGPVNLMASDSSKASDKMAKVELSLGGTDEVQMRKIFDGLAEGGEVRMPLEKQFWGDTFGMLTDKYGVDWMMNIGENMQ
jgi:PhnB protein